VRIIWNVGVAALPLGIVLAGYHAWRRVCPLAFFATLGQRLNRPGKRKAGEWLGRHHLDVQLGLLAAALAFRLLAANEAPWALAALFAAVIAAALATGFLCTGKTWCNHLCPVGLVEKLYLEPTQLRPPAANSQCATCTACKKNCPDIDLEQAYWKEADLPARRRAYHLWPGLVAGYFLYPWLATGSWGAFGSSAWSPAGGAPSPFSPGLFFLPWLPRILAVPAALAASALVGAGAIRLLEAALRRGGSEDSQARHRAMALAAFTGFLLFYAFAGRAVLGLLPEWLGDLLGVSVAVAATLVLVFRWQRTETDFVQEKFARGLLKRWEWGEAPATGRLGDLYLIHHERTQQKEARLSAYKATVRDLLADGVLDQGNLRLLQRMRTELGISGKDEEKLLSDLDLEDRRLLDPDYQASMEKRLQLEQYRGELEALLLDGTGSAPDPGLLEALRRAHRVDKADHDALLAGLRGEAGPLRARLQEPVATLLDLHRASLAADQLASGEGSSEPVRTRRLAFFRHVIHWRQRQEAGRILGILERIPGWQDLGPLRRMLDGPGPETTRELLPALGAMGDVAQELRPLAHPPCAPGAPLPALLQAAGDGSTYLRAAALGLLALFPGRETEAALRTALVDTSSLVRETAQAALGAPRDLAEVIEAFPEDDAQAWLVRAAIQALPEGSARPRAGEATLRAPAALGHLAVREAPLALIEKLSYLHGAPLFAELDPETLEALALTAQERRWVAEETLCRQGEWSADVFIVLRGRLRAWVRDAEGRLRVLGDSSEGACLGEMAALDPAPRTATLTALTEVRALVLEGATFRDALQARPEVADGVLRVLTRRLRSVIREVQSGG
jgi:ferredoxin